MKLRCIIVDDEPLALDILEDYIGRIPGLTLAGRYTSSADALAALRGGAVDVAFLDIHMPGLSGLDLARAVGRAGVATRVVFTTAFPDYALEGFRVDALDYLLKPVSFDEFSQTVTRARAWFGPGHRYRTEGAGSAVAAVAAAKALIVKSRYKQIVIPLANIVRIEGMRDYILIHTIDPSGIPSLPVRTLMNMGTVERLLPAEDFARIHRSHIVALDRVVGVERGYVLLNVPSRCDEPLKLPLSDTCKPYFTRILSARAVGAKS